MKRKTIQLNSPVKIYLPKKLISLLFEEYPKAKRKSDVIRLALEDYLGHNFSETKPEDFGMYLVLTKEDRDDLTAVSLRLSGCMCTYIRNKVRKSETADNMSQMIIIMIGQVLYFRGKRAQASISNKNLFELADIAKNAFENDAKPWEHSKRFLHIHGNKFDEKMLAMIKWIIEKDGNKHWEISVETCVGGLGIFSNFSFADKSIINDDDWRKMNLYRAIKHSPEDLIQRAREHKVDKETFKNIKREKDQEKDRAGTSDIDIEAAARFLYLNFASYWHKGSSFKKDASNEKYHDTLMVAYSLNRKLKNATLLEEDLFSVIEKYINKKNILFIIDPPYLDSQDYSDREVRKVNEHGKKFGWKKHKKLAKMIQQIKKNGNDFIYFCRTTYRNRSLSAEELEEWNRYMEGRIDTLYLNHGFFNVDVKIDKNVTERILTSFHFEGATLYGKGGN